ncbi:hypothetical protein TRVL_02470 [Trypanosoma vivax]|nr:hypothetical protein TRVL_02470 [Trypanosoma vivax]
MFVSHVVAARLPSYPSHCHFYCPPSYFTTSVLCNSQLSFADAARHDGGHAGSFLSFSHFLYARTCACVSVSLLSSFCSIDKLTHWTWLARGGQGRGQHSGQVATVPELEIGSASDGSAQQRCGPGAAFEVYDLIAF